MAYSSRKERKDQAARLREKVLHPEMDKEELVSEKLPPRSEYHQEKDRQKRTKWKVKYPVVRLLLIVFLLILVFVPFYNQIKERALVGGVAGGGESSSEDVTFARSGNDSPTSSDELGSNQDKGGASEEENRDGATDEPESDKKNEQKESSKEPPPQTENEDVKENPESTNTRTDTKADESESRDRQQSDDTEEQYDIVHHTVKDGETLFRISMSYYNSRDGEALIRNWNNLEGNNVYAGQVLEIPIKK